MAALSGGLPAPGSPGPRSAAVPPPRIHSARRPWSWVWATAGAALAAAIGYAFWAAKTISHQVIGEYLFNAAILHGALQTLALTVTAMVIGILLGMVLALLRQSRNAGLRLLSGGYIWLFRGTPVLLQILIWFNISLVFPRLVIGLPFTSIHLVDSASNQLITPFAAAVLGLGLNEGAYMAEIVRSGLLAVPPGEIDAARALGIPPLRVFRRVTLPQALRVIVPPTGNEVIGMLKTSSLTSVIGYAELLLVSERIYGQNLQVMELLIVAGIWYLVMTTALSVLQRPIEARLGRGYTAARRTFGSRRGQR
jgi:polar amino acid transport system permease protein